MKNDLAIIVLRGLISDDRTDKENEALRFAIKKIREDKWIPVSRRLPDKDGTYQVSGVWESGKEQVGECVFYVDDGYFQASWNFDVIAWKSLPEPYKKEGE